MRIGIDFDNTIVCYDQLFFKLAIEQGCPAEKISENKRMVRDYYRSIDQEHIWTEMQGTAYGSRIVEATPFPGFLTFLASAHAKGHQLYIVSHKTKHPFRGEAHDLHQAALTWLEHHQILDRLIPRNQIFLELTKGEKIARIAALGCDYFIDDLPEILLDQNFPTKVSRVLFDPATEQPQSSAYKILNSWDQMNRLLEAGR